MTMFIRFVSVMCVVGVSESYLVPNGAAHHVNPRTKTSGVQEIRVKQQPVVEAEESTSSMNPLILGMIAGLVAAFVSASTPAYADAAAGQPIFDANCGGCHKAGGNLLAPDKKLTKEALDKFGFDQAADIKQLVMKGKSSMPAFGEKISAADVDNVADYVREKAANGW